MPDGRQRRKYPGLRRRRRPRSPDGTVKRARAGSRREDGTTVDFVMKPRAALATRAAPSDRHASGHRRPNGKLTKGTVKLVYGATTSQWPDGPADRRGFRPAARRAGTCPAQGKPGGPHLLVPGAPLVFGRRSSPQQGVAEGQLGREGASTRPPRSPESAGGRPHHRVRGQDAQERLTSRRMSCGASRTAALHQRPDGPQEDSQFKTYVETSDRVWRRHRLAHVEQWLSPSSRRTRATGSVSKTLARMPTSSR